MNLKSKDSAQVKCRGNWKQFWRNCYALVDFFDCSWALYGSVCV